MIDDSNLWRAADAVLAELLERPVEERARRLAGLPLDQAVRAATQRLLQMHDRHGLLDRPLPRLALAPESAVSGRRLGRWLLLEEIGRGGMSVVYRAQAVDTPQQGAAVKLLTLGALAAGGVERFQHEQAVLARLRHPHIATLLEAGVAADGTPWLAMALVDGVRIDQWCAQHALGPAAIVALLLQVCDAVAYAHRNLVIHRDLKPSNVLVDDDGHVRLLDFGIARLIDDAAEATASQWRALTPEYAAPEQFGSAPASTAMDVYGLGALAYRLLSGESPRRTGSAPDTSPPPASLAARGSPVATLLRGDLDAILAKSLASDPTQRFESALALAQDLEAWSARRPVRARGPGVAYRLLRFIDRHRVGVAAGSAVVLAMVIGTAVALWQAQRAETQSVLATQHAARAAAVRDFLVSVFDAADPERAGGAELSTRDVVALGAARAREEFDGEPALRAELLRVIGSVQRRTGAIDAARATLAAAEQAADAAAALPAIEWAQLHYEQGVVEAVADKLERSVLLLERALARLDANTGRSATLLRAQVLGELALAAQQKNDFVTALERLDAADAALATLAPPDASERIVAGTMRVSVLNAAGRFADAAALSTALVEQARAAGLDDRASFARLLSNASKLASAVGDAGQAIEHAEEALRVVSALQPDDDAAIAGAQLSLGNAYRVARRPSEAAPSLRSAYERLHVSGDIDARSEAAMLLGRVLLDLGQAPEALTLAQRELAADRGDEATRLRVFGLLDLALRAARDSDRAAFIALASDAQMQLEASPPHLAAHPMAQRPRRRLAHWRLDDGDPAAAMRLADTGILAAGDAPTADVLILHAVAVRARQALQRDDANSAFAALIEAAAATRGLAPIEAETRLAMAQAADAIDHVQRADYVQAAERAHAATPLPPNLAAQLDTLRRH